MNRWCFLSLTLAACGGLASCATDEQKAIKAGEIRLSQSEIAKIFPGNTISRKGPRGQVSHYYYKDGRKITKEANQLTLGKWWLTGKGQWCETLIENSGSKVCAPAIYKDGFGLTWYAEDGEAIGIFAFIPGNLEGIEHHDQVVRSALNDEIN